MFMVILYFPAVGTNNGVIRVVNRESSERSLLKGIEGMVQDIAFAHIPNEVVLACVDGYGNLLVHRIEETKDKMVYPSQTKYHYLYINAKACNCKFLDGSFCNTVSMYSETIFW
jgi:hypothetical protein